MEEGMAQAIGQSDGLLVSSETLSDLLAALGDCLGLGSWRRGARSKRRSLRLPRG
jgi:hypothetical protein